MKKLLCLFLLFALVFPLPACGAARNTAYHASGMEGDKLYVNYEGNTLVYERCEPGSGSLTPVTMLDMFETETHIEGIAWVVYATEEYPDLSYVLLISGTNVVWTYRAAEQTP